MIRHWSKCRNGDEAGGYLGDRSLGIEGSLSRLLEQRICLLGADLSFAKPQRWLKQLKAVQLGQESVHLRCERDGAKMATSEPTDKTTTERFARSQGHVKFFVDAVEVDTREEGWKDLKIASCQRRPRAEPSEPRAWSDRELPEPTIRVAFGSIATAKRLRRPWNDR